MKVNITTHPEFERQLRRFVKKYRSLVDDYAKLLGRLRDNPFQGNDLGGHIMTLYRIFLIFFYRF